MWKREFTSARRDVYRSYFSEGYDVVCPMTGPNYQTWFNGMFIHRNAFSGMKEIRPNSDRFYFQRLFCGKNIKGVLKEKVKSDYLVETLIALHKNAPNS